ncbi:hypothetical protein ACFLZM_08690 [Thermodesulfobacteriota bacterium]
MKSYVIDELRFDDYNKIKAYANKHFDASGVDDVYWIPLDQDFLNDTQAAHQSCRPFYFALDLESNRLACEFLIRTKNRVRCSCMAYATEMKCKIKRPARLMSGLSIVQEILIKRYPINIIHPGGVKMFVCVGFDLVIIIKSEFIDYIAFHTKKLSQFIKSCKLYVFKRTLEIRCFLTERVDINRFIG